MAHELTVEQIQDVKSAFEKYKNKPDKSTGNEADKMDIGIIEMALSDLKIGISKKEIKEFLSGLGNPAYIDFSIFMRLSAIKFKEIEFIKELESAFKSFDTKNKGFLTYNELSLILTENGQCLSPEESKELLKSLEIFGVFNYSEFVKDSI